MTFNLTNRQLIGIAVGLFALGGVAGLCTGVFGLKGVPLGTKVTARDTVTVTKWDTVTIEKPFKEIQKVLVEVVKVEYDTVFRDRPYVAGGYINIPITQSLYSKNECTVLASGYGVSIDRVTYPIKSIQRTITNTVTKSYDNELSLGVSISTAFAGTYNMPIVAGVFMWDKGRNHTFARVGATWISGKTSFYFETGYTIKIW